MGIINSSPGMEGKVSAKLSDLFIGQDREDLVCDGFIAEFNAFGLQSFRQAKELNALPIGLVNEKTRVKVDVKKGQLITYDMVELDENSFLLNLRRKQDQMLEEGTL